MYAMSPEFLRHKGMLSANSPEFFPSTLTAQDVYYSALGYKLTLPHIQDRLTNELVGDCIHTFGVDVFLYSSKSMRNNLRILLRFPSFVQACSMEALLRSTEVYMLHGKAKNVDTHFWHYFLFGDHKEYYRPLLHAYEELEQGILERFIEDYDEEVLEIDDTSNNMEYLSRNHDAFLRMYMPDEDEEEDSCSVPSCVDEGEEPPEIE